MFPVQPDVHKHSDTLLRLRTSAWTTLEQTGPIGNAIMALDPGPEVSHFVNVAVHLIQADGNGIILFQQWVKALAEHDTENAKLLAPALDSIRRAEKLRALLPEAGAAAQRVISAA